MIIASYFNLIPKKASLSRYSGYLLAKSHAPVPPCSEDEEVSKPVQEAGNATNLKTDPELGLAEIS